MLLILAAAVLLACEPEAPIRYCDSLIVEQTRSAIARVRTAAAGLPRVGTAVYEGTVRVEGHLMRPGMTYERPARLELAFDTDAGLLRICESSGSGRSASVETIIVRGGRIAKQERASEPFREVTAHRAEEEAAAACWFPALAARAALERAPSCRAGAAVGEGEAALTPVSFNDAAARACTLLMDDKGRIKRVEILTSDERLGDVCNWTNFGDWKERGGAGLPERIERFGVLSDATVRYELSFVSFSGAAPASAFDLPPEHAGTVADWGAVRIDGLTVSEIGKGLWEIDVDATDSRVLVIERERDLVMLEAPADDAVCRNVLAKLRERFPTKPVGLVAIGHHHPASSGGLRAIAATGATIVIPRTLETYVRGVFDRPTSLAAPSRVSGEPKIEVFDGERTIEAGGASVRLVDIGEKSAHAFSYVVFWFPRLGVLFEGDLGYFPTDGAIRVGPRIRGLVTEMDRLGIKPERLVQAWPVKGVSREVPWADVVKALRPDTKDER